jgi:hypothetical protein
MRRNARRNDLFFNSVSFEQIMYNIIIADTVLVVGMKTMLRIGRLCFRTPAGAGVFALL